MGADNINASLPQDLDSSKIQVLAPDDTTVASGTISGSSSAITLPTGAQIVEITSQDLNYASFAGVATTNSRLMVAGTVVYRVPKGATTYNILQVGASAGKVTVTKLV